MDEDAAVVHFTEVARELGVVIIVSFYEKDINQLYNTVAVIDADGTRFGIYRKTHIPDDHYYQENSTLFQAIQALRCLTQDSAA